MDWFTYHHMQAGLSHIRAGRPCEDNVLVKEKDEYIVAALADGIGMLSHSELTSKCAVQAITGWLLERKDELSDRLKTMLSDEQETLRLKSQMIETVQTAIRTLAKENGFDEDRMGCNLAFALIMPQSALIGQLGDCAVGVAGYSKQHVYTDNNGNATATASVMDSNAVSELHLYQENLGRIHSIILTSDGLDGVVYRKNSSHLYKSAEWFINNIQSISGDGETERLVKYLDEQTQNDETLDDDISIAVLSRRVQRLSLNNDPMWLCSCGCHNPMFTTYCVQCNTDFFKLYHDLPDDIDSYFLDLNKNPEREERLLEEIKSRFSRSGSIGMGGRSFSNAPVVALEPVPLQKASEDEEISKETDSSTQNTESTSKTGNELPNSENKLSDKEQPYLEDMEKERSDSEDEATDVGEVSEEDNYRNRADIESESHNHKNLMYADTSELGVVAVEKEEEKNPGRRFNPLLIIAALLSVIAILGVTLIIGWLFRDNEKPEWIKVDGGYYSGSTNHKLPDGKGVFYRDGCYFFGNFRDGEAVGTFTVIERLNPEYPTTISADEIENYSETGYKSPQNAGNFNKVQEHNIEEDEESDFSQMDEMENESTSNMYVVTTRCFLREKAGSDSKQMAVEIVEGDVVLLEEQQGEKWGFVTTESGESGWCYMSNLEVAKD